MTNHNENPTNGQLVKVFFSSMCLTLAFAGLGSFIDAGCSQKNSIKEVPWSETPEWAKNTETKKEAKFQSKQIFKGNTKEQIDSYFISVDRILNASCECFGKNDNFETTKEECLDTMDSSDDFRVCARKVFEHSTTVNSTDYTSFFDCYEKNSIVTAHYFETECDNMTSDNYNDVIVYFGELDDCGLDRETVLELEKCGNGENIEY